MQTSKEWGLVTGENSSTLSNELDLVENHCFRLFLFFLLTDINLLLYLDSSRLVHKTNTKKANPETEDRLGFLVVIQAVPLKMGC